MCSSLLVDIVKCCGIVCSHLYGVASNERLKGVERFEDCKQFQIVDMKGLLVRRPSGMNV